MRTVLVGNRRLARYVLAHLIATGWDVVGAVAAGGEAARRQAGHASFDDIAESNELELIETSSVNRDAVVERLSALEPDLCLCPGWHEIIDQRVLDVPSTGFLGFHASELPRGRGGAPVNWAIIEGSETCGLSLFRYTAGVDAGDIVAQTTVPIDRRDDVGTVLDRLALAAMDLLDGVRSPILSGEVPATPQSLSDASYRPRREPEDGLIDWSLEPATQHDWIRAQTAPYPGAYTFYDGRRVHVWKATLMDSGTVKREPGTILEVREGAGLDVASGSSSIRITRLQVDDDPPVWADQASNRYGICPGERLGIHHAPVDWLYTGIKDARGGTDFETNLASGCRGELLAVAAAGGTANVTVRAELDGDVVCAEVLPIDGGSAKATIPYAPSDPGTKTLRVSFHRGDERIDVRYLKLFVSE